MNSKKKLFSIYKFNKYKEGNRREVKTAEEKIPADLWRTYSAFANTNGGVIILGVKERKDGSWTVTGIKDPVKYEKDFWNQIHSNKVSMNLLNEDDVEFYNYEGKEIMVIYVPRAQRENRPVFLNNDLYHETYRRNGDGDYHCTKSEIHAMIRDNSSESMDLKVLTDMSVSDLCKDTIRSYRNRFRGYKPEHVWNDLSDEEFLERINAVKYSKEDGEYHPTGAGLLMFAEEYKIHYEYPHYFLDYKEMLDIEYRWADRVESSSGTWSGNVFDFYMKVVNKLTADIKVPFHLEGITRIDDTPVHKAIREALVNCLTNADYYLRRGLVVNKYRDKIVLENPGSIRLGKYQMLKGGRSDPRNETLLQMFNHVGVGERAGSGVPSIISVWKKQGWKAPTVVEEFGVDRTIVTLEFIDNYFSSVQKILIEKDAELSNLTLNQFNEVLEYLRMNGECSSKDVSEILGLKLSRARDVISKMIELNIIVAIGIGRNRKYQMTNYFIALYSEKKPVERPVIKNLLQVDVCKKDDNNAVCDGYMKTEVIKTVDKKPVLKKPSIKNVDKKTSIKDEKKKKIVEFLASHTLAKASEIAEDIGLQQSYTRNYLRELVKEDIIAIEGTNKNRRYKLKE